MAEHTSLEEATRVTETVMTDRYDDPRALDDAIEHDTMSGLLWDSERHAYKVINGTIYMDAESVDASIEQQLADAKLMLVTTTFNDRALVTVPADGRGAVEVYYLADDGHPYDPDDALPASDGWLEGTTLFVPADGQAPVGTAYLDDDLSQPDPSAGWYEATTGRRAVVIPVDNRVANATFTISVIR